MYKPIASLIDKTYADFKQPNPSKIPSCEKLNRFLTHKNLNNKLLRFVTQDHKLPYPELSYEERIYNHGIIATRKHNWHDYFNALVWLKFPMTKSVINAIHYLEISQQKTSLRSPRRDLLTLFDECGIIILANTETHDLIKEHKWQRLFVEHKEQWLKQEIKQMTFGHAMYEKYLNPYIGMTAKALVLPKSVKDCDKFLASKIFQQQLLTKKTELLPLPVLGIPQWYKQQTEEFYNNKTYFR